MALQDQFETEEGNDDILEDKVMLVHITAFPVPSLADILIERICDDLSDISLPNAITTQLTYQAD